MKKLILLMLILGIFAASGAIAQSVTAQVREIDDLAKSIDAKKKRSRAPTLFLPICRTMSPTPLQMQQFRVGKGPRSAPGQERGVQHRLTFGPTEAKLHRPTSLSSAPPATGPSTSTPTFGPTARWPVSSPSFGRFTETISVFDAIILLKKAKRSGRPSGLSISKRESRRNLQMTF